MLRTLDRIRRTVPPRAPRRNVPPRGDSLVVEDSYPRGEGIPVRGSFAEARVAPICLRALKIRSPISPSSYFPFLSAVPLVCLSFHRRGHRAVRIITNPMRRNLGALRALAAAERDPPASKNAQRNPFIRCSPRHREIIRLRKLRSPSSLARSLSVSPSSPSLLISFLPSSCVRIGRVSRVPRTLSRAFGKACESREPRACTRAYPLSSPPFLCLSACLSGYLRFFIYARSNSSSTR